MPNLKEHFESIIPLYPPPGAKECTALLYFQYLQSKKTTDDIDDDIQLGSEKYKDFNQYDERGTGSLLYGKLVLEFYQTTPNDLGPEEVEILNSLKPTLDALIQHPRTNVKNNLEALTQQANVWLGKVQNNDAEQVKQLCLALYMAVQIAKVTISEKKDSWMFKALVSGDVHSIEDSLGALQEKIKGKIDELNAVIATAPPIKTLQEHFDEQSSIIIKKTIPSEQMLAELNAHLDASSQDFERLIQLREEKADIEKKLTVVNNMTTLMSDNESKIIKKKFFIELMNQSDDTKEQFKQCMDIIPESKEKKQLSQEKEELENPTTRQELVSMLQWTVSWATSVTTAIWRYAASEALQNVVASVFDTKDSACKSKFLKLATDESTQLRARIIAKEYEINELQAKLIPDEKVRQQLDNATNDSLNEILQKTQAEKILVENLVKAHAELHDTKLHLHYVKSGKLDMFLAFQVLVLDFTEKRFPLIFKKASEHTRFEEAKSLHESQKELTNIIEHFDKLTPDKYKDIVKQNAEQKSDILRVGGSKKEHVEAIKNSISSMRNKLPPEDPTPGSSQTP